MKRRQGLAITYCGPLTTASLGAIPVMWTMIATMATLILTRTALNIKKCCSRRDAVPETTDVDKGMRTLLMLKQAELKEQCRIRGLAVSGTNKVLAQRLLASQPKDDPPSEAQLIAMAHMERKRGLTLDPLALSSKRKASERIAKLTEITT